MKRLLGLICLVFIALLISMSFACEYITERVTRFDLPKGELKWTKTRPTNTRLCIPAAFSEADGGVVGSYRIDGQTYQRSRMRMKVSLKDEIFYISRTWMSDNGFQQLTLVCDSKPMKFQSTDRSMRRALCKDKNGAFILESNYPMTLTSFAYYCSNHATNATYLDMGEYGYGYIKQGRVIRPLHIWGFFSRHKQTNWLYIE